MGYAAKWQDRTDTSPQRHDIYFVMFFNWILQFCTTKLASHLINLVVEWLLLFTFICPHVATTFCSVRAREKPVFINYNSQPTVVAERCNMTPKLLPLVKLYRTQKSCFIFSNATVDHILNLSELMIDNDFMIFHFEKALWGNKQVP